MEDELYTCYLRVKECKSRTSKGLICFSASFSEDQVVWKNCTFTNTRDHFVNASGVRFSHAHSTAFLLCLTQTMLQTDVTRPHFQQRSRNNAKQPTLLVQLKPQLANAKTIKPCLKSRTIAKTKYSLQRNYKGRLHIKKAIHHCQRREKLEGRRMGGKEREGKDDGKSES